ncbi:MAG: Eco57I restriction-modification methylase domain-containing protein [Fluviicola sp.]
MDKKSAISLIEDTFNEKFNDEQFSLFARNLLNDIEERDNSYAGNLIWDDHKEHITSYKRIGKYIDPNGNALDVLTVEVKAASKLERARASLRNFVIKHLKRFEKDYALVAFHAADDDDWRFSFIKLEHKAFLDEEKGKVKMSKEFTPAKRYSFLVGKNEKTYTAKNQLLPLLQSISNNPTVEELENAFSIEKVTDEFFNQYKDLYVKLFTHFENDNHVKSELEKAKIDTARFTKKLLGQIVFLYFLQKKGWLGVPKNEPWGKGDKIFVQNLFNASKQEGVNFFKDKLQYLFYEALAKERNNSNSFYNYFDCRIPFLNGGLFEADYEWKTANITIPETLFRNEEKNKSGDIGSGVLDVFDRYNFTIKEDEPLDKEVAVDPEMLGKVFENMLDSTERKGKGAFYTPREIVHYMCQESLIYYLDNALNNYENSYQPIDSDQLRMFAGSRNKKGNLKIEFEHRDGVLVPKNDIETFIRKGHFALENDQRVAAKGESKTYQYQLPESIRLNADLIDQKLSDIRICDPAIGSGAFPVGLLHELVNAMLVLKPHFSYDYLTEKLKSFEFQYRESVNDSRYIYRLKRHVIQESIYGVDIDASAIDIARLRLWLSLVVDEDDLDPIETLPNLDYKIVCGNSLIGLSAQGADRFPQLKDELEILKIEFFKTTDEKRKKNLRYKINEKIQTVLDASEDYDGYKIDFDFKLFFSEVWSEKKGFDIVIGNPPYISYYGNKGQKLTESEKQYFFNAFHHIKKKNDRINSMNLMTELGINLLNKYGSLTFIVNKTMAVLPSYYQFREYLLKNTGLNFIITNLDPFEAIVDCIIFCVQTQDFNCPVKYYSGQLKDFSLISKNKFLSNHNLELHQSNFDEVISKIEKQPLTFDNLIVINRGVNIGGCFDHFLSNKPNDNYFKYIGGTKNIKPFYYEWDERDGYFKFDQDLEQQLKLNGATIALGNPDRYEQNRIFIPESGQHIMAAYSNEKIYGAYGLLVGTSENEDFLRYALFLLNSELITFYALQKEILRKGNKATPHVGVKGLRGIPVPKLEHYYLVNCITEYLNFLSFKKTENLLKDFFVALLNSCVYELYFTSEVKSAGKELLKHLGDLKPILDKMGEEEKLAVIQSEFERLYNPTHPIRFAIETLDSVEEVRMIKEALK